MIPAGHPPIYKTANWTFSAPGPVCHGQDAAPKIRIQRLAVMLGMIILRLACLCNQKEHVH